MCDPVTIGSLALSGIGTVMQMQSQAAAQRKTQAAIASTDEKNQQLRQQSQAQLGTAEDKFKRPAFDQNQADATTQITKQLQDPQSQGSLPGEYYGAGTGDNTKQYAEAKSAESSKFTQNYAAALAKLRGFGQGQLSNNTGIARAGEQVGVNASKIQGNDNLLPIELQSIQNGAGSPLGDIFTGLGSAGLSAGLAKPAGPNIIWNPATVAKQTPFGVRNFNLS